MHNDEKNWKAAGLGNQDPLDALNTDMARMSQYHENEALKATIKEQAELIEGLEAEIEELKGNNWNSLSEKEKDNAIKMAI